MIIIDRGPRRIVEIEGVISPRDLNGIELWGFSTVMPSRICAHHLPLDYHDHFDHHTTLQPYH